MRERKERYEERIAILMADGMSEWQAKLKAWDMVYGVVFRKKENRDSES